MAPVPPKRNVYMYIYIYVYKYGSVRLICLIKVTLFRTVVCKGKKSAEIVVLGPSGANLELSWSGLALLVLARFGLVQLGRAQLSLFRCWLGAAWNGSVRLCLDRVGPAWLNMVCNVFFLFFSPRVPDGGWEGKMFAFIVKT